METILPFDPQIHDDAEFKEDSVREEIVHPLLVRRGYASSGDSRIIRSPELGFLHILS